MVVVDPYFPRCLFTSLRYFSSRLSAGRTFHCPESVCPSFGRAAHWASPEFVWTVNWAAIPIYNGVGFVKRHSHLFRLWEPEAASGAVRRFLSDRSSQTLDAADGSPYWDGVEAGAKRGFILVSGDHRVTSRMIHGRSWFEVRPYLFHSSGILVGSGRCPAPPSAPRKAPGGAGSQENDPGRSGTKGALHSGSGRRADLYPLSLVQDAFCSAARSSEARARAPTRSVGRPRRNRPLTARTAGRESAPRERGSPTENPEVPIFSP